MAKRVGVTYRREDKLIHYEDALREVGLLPVRLHPDQPFSLDGLDGLMLTGGTDVDPALYHEDRHPQTDNPPDPDRDAMETRCIEEALARDLPTLCICRGLQLLNVMRGGTLIQHLPSTHVHRQKQVQEAHTVQVLEGTRLARLVGAGEHTVNSRHHQAAGHIGEGLVVAARSADGVVEALEITDRRFAIAVQWHPEERVRLASVDRALLESFAKAL